MKKSYTVNLGSQLQFEGTLYAYGATVALTDEQAAYPLASGCVTECPQPAAAPAIGGRKQATSSVSATSAVSGLDVLVPSERQVTAKP